MFSLGTVDWQEYVTPRETMVFSKQRFWLCGLQTSQIESYLDGLPMSPKDSFCKHPFSFQMLLIS